MYRLAHDTTPPISNPSQKRIISEEIEKKKQERVKREASKKVRNVPQEKNKLSQMMSHRI